MDSERSLAITAASNQANPLANRRGATREVLLDAALAGFSRDGFAGTSIRDLARAAGIRESSVYKHFNSKQAIFDALVERADQRMAQAASQLGATMSSAAQAADTYRGISEDALADMARGLFDFVVHDPQFAQLRRLMAIEQHRDQAVAERYRSYFITGPLAFQTELFQALAASWEFRDDLDPQQTALAFWSPIYLLIDYADGGGDLQNALDLLAGHVHHFRQTHLKEPS